MTSHTTNNKTRQLQLSRLLQLPAAFLLLGHVFSTATASMNADQGFVSLKLNSRHAELDRRRRERKLIAVANDNDNGNDNGNDMVKEENKEEYRLRRREEAVQVGALFEGYGTHYIDLWCGSPPQRQTVIVDTGSGVTAFPCSGCRDCGVPDYHIDRLFVEEESETFHESTCAKKSDCIMTRSSCQSGSCKIGMSYAEGSRWNAVEVVDRCYVAGPHETPLMADTDTDIELTKTETETEIDLNADADDMDPKHAAELAFDMTFGCQTLVTGLFKTQLADGIMGMSNQASTFWSQMYRANKMGSDQQFSLCFSRPPTITKEGTEAGAMTLGGSDKRLHLSSMVYTPSSDKGRSSFFSVKVRKFYLRDGKYGESVQSTAKNPNMGVTALDVADSLLNSGGIIVDSGTTDTYWNSGIAREFGKVFQEKTGWAHHNEAISLTEAQLKALPTILLQLYSDDVTNSHVDKYKTPGLAGAMDASNPSDVILAIPPSHYMEYNPDKKKYTSRFYPTERSGSVLGANAMMGHDVFFDMETMRIGWAESDCDYTNTVTNAGYDFDITGKLNKVEYLAKYQNHGNNKHKGKDSDSVACETITSGNKCQKTEGCTWGWGKCTQKVTEIDGPTETPNYVVPTTTDRDEDAAGGGGGGDQQIINVDALMEQATLHRTEILVAGLVGTLLLCCCWYTLCCRSSKNNSSRGKYARAAVSATSIEMTDGEGFQDEPDDNDNDNDDDNDDLKSNGSRSRASGQFRDNPEEPEFEGDFA